VPGHQPVIAYRGDHRFSVTPEEVWKAIENVDSFERWWSWLEEFRLEGDGLVAGAVLHGVVAPPVPYRMRVDVHLIRCDRPRAIDARIAGDLSGESELRLVPEGSGTHVAVGWTVEMMQRPMRLASRVAHPLLRWGHDRVVDMTVVGFRRNVERGR
jgi:carbon monoxide dehydrogenase subunit G